MNNISAYNSNINFGTNYNVSHLGLFRKKHLKHQTHFERSDLDWAFTFRQIKKRNIKKILCYACSDGSEAVTFALGLGKKYLINAFDISRKIIKKAQKGIFSFSDLVEEDQKFLNKHEEYFTPNGNNDCIGFCVKDNAYEWASEYIINKSVLKNISFKVSNILKASKKKCKEPVVVAFRNAWYLLKNDKERIKLAKNLHEKLKAGSIVIIGESETSHKTDTLYYNIDHLLEKTGFIPIKKKPNEPARIFIKQ